MAEAEAKEGRNSVSFEMGGGGEGTNTFFARRAGVHF